MSAQVTATVLILREFSRGLVCVSVLGCADGARKMRYVGDDRELRMKQEYLL
jgi:hypothetical protein